MTQQAIQAGDDVLADMEATLRTPLRRAAALSVLSSLLWPFQAYLAGNLIADLLNGTASSSVVTLYAALFALVGIARNSADATASGWMFKAAQELVRAQRLDLTLRASLRSPLSSAPLSSAAVATLIGNKMELILTWATRYKMSAIKARIVPLGILAIVLVQSWAAALILLLCGPLIPVFMALIGFAARDASEKHLAEQGSLNASLLECLTAGPDIRILAAEKVTIERFEAAAQALKQKTMAVLRIAFLSSTVLEFFSSLGIALVAVYVGFSLLGVFSFGAYGGALPIASGIFILMMTPDFFQPLRELSAAWHDRAAAQALASEIAAFRAGTDARILGAGAAAAKGLDDIRVETSALSLTLPSGASLTYPDLLIEKGEKVALVGPSGVGKSTLLSLVAGLVSPRSGKITVCGAPLTTENADSWRAKIALVGQSPHMLNGSLASNLALSSPQASRQDVMAALTTAAAGDVVARLPRGLQERLGENGAGVSGGEARRLMIARAVLSNAALIIADEPTADLDAETAAIITDALIRAASEGATLLVATHDPRLASRMDRIIDLGAKP